VFDKNAYQDKSFGGCVKLDKSRGLACIKQFQYLLNSPVATNPSLFSSAVSSLISITIPSCEIFYLTLQIYSYSKYRAKDQVLTNLNREKAAGRNNIPGSGSCEFKAPLRLNLFLPPKPILGISPID
jgi:hypothetical protein